MDYIDMGIEVLNIIESKGYQAYIIGGAVRDYLLNIKINDIDIATNMPLEDLKTIFHVKETGSLYGSVTIIVNNFMFEVTRFRKDIVYENHRHPVISFVDCLEEDVIRRDFTINAMAMDKNKNILDFFNGQEDLKLKRIKAILNPNRRFEEDALRILRAIYFSSKLGFYIEESTLQAMIEKRHLLKNLSNERLYAYFIKIIYAPYNNGLEYISKYNLFEHIKEYKNWLAIIKKDYKEEDLPIYYYLHYKDYPPKITNFTKRKCVIADELIRKNFDLYSIYKFQNELSELLYVFSNLGYDIMDLEKKWKTLKIKNDKELKVSKEEISLMVEKERTSLVVEQIIRAILEGQIDNNRTSIIIFLKGLGVVKC